MRGKVAGCLRLAASLAASRLLRLSRYVSPLFLSLLRRRPQESAALADRLIQVASKIAILLFFHFLTLFLPTFRFPAHLRLPRLGKIRPFIFLPAFPEAPAHLPRFFFFGGEGGGFQGG